MEAVIHSPIARVLCFLAALLLALGPHTASGSPERTPRIRVYTEMLEVDPDAGERSAGERIWWRDYEIESGESILLDYMDESSGASYALELELAIPEDGKPPDQLVELVARWRRGRAEERDQRFGIDGEFGATIFRDPDTGREIHLRVRPRILWPGIVPGATSPSYPIRLLDAYLIVEDRVIRRGVKATGDELILADDEGEICRIAASPETPGTAPSGSFQGSRMALVVGSLRLEILDSANLAGRESTPVYVSCRRVEALATAEPGSLDLLGE